MEKKEEERDMRILIIIVALLIGAIGFLFYGYQTYHQIPLIEIIY